MKILMLILSGLVLVGCGSTAADLPPSTVPSVTEESPTTAMTEYPSSSVAEDEVTGERDDTAQGLQGEVAKDLDHAKLLNQVLLAQGDGPNALAQIRESGDTQFVAALIDTLRYRRDLYEDIGYTLNTLTDQNLDGGWFEWVEWVGQHPEINSFAAYDSWKADLFAQIDPDFLRFVYPNVAVDPGSRLEEIVWGGVRVDGIPALDNPLMLEPEAATYLVSQERVFGVSINGDTRAYPARFLDWHEMFNDIVGGEPVSLAY